MKKNQVPDQQQKFADIGAGTIVGSAIFNILVIIGASATFRKAKLTWQPVVRDALFYSLAYCYCCTLSGTGLLL